MDQAAETRRRTEFLGLVEDFLTDSIDPIAAYRAALADLERTIELLRENGVGVQISVPSMPSSLSNHDFALQIATNVNAALVLVRSIGVTLRSQTYEAERRDSAARQAPAPIRPVNRARRPVQPSAHSPSIARTLAWAFVSFVVLVLDWNWGRSRWEQGGGVDGIWVLQVIIVIASLISLAASIFAVPAAVKGQESSRKAQLAYMNPSCAGMNKKLSSSSNVSRLGGSLTTPGYKGSKRPIGHGAIPSSSLKQPEDCAQMRIS